MMMMMIAGRVERGTEAHGAPFHVPANLAVVEVVSGAVSVFCDCVLSCVYVSACVGVDCSVVYRVPQRVGRGVRSIAACLIFGLFFLYKNEICTPVAASQFTRSLLVHLHRSQVGVERDSLHQDQPSYSLQVQEQIFPQEEESPGSSTLDNHYDNLCNYGEYHDLCLQSVSNWTVCLCDF